MKKRMLVLPLLALMMVLPVVGAKAAGVDFYNAGFGINKTIPGSGGKVIFNEPKGKVQLMLTAIVQGLAPKHTYYVYIWAEGQSGWYLGPYEASVGTWIRIGRFTTSQSGNGVFHFNFKKGYLASGKTLDITVWIDEDLAPTYTTVLVSTRHAYTLQT